MSPSKMDFAEEIFEAKLNKDEYQIIGENSLTKELILQLKHFSPSELEQAKQFIQSLPMVQNARILTGHQHGSAFLSR